jgi:pSer/pThr/pTyr-binding forkhead associated (FHA) protein
MFKLILRFQDAVVKEFSFEETPVSMGRREENDIVVDNMAVSGHHATIEKQEPNLYVLVDLESLNGTFIGDKRVERVTLYDGDVFTIGKHTLEFKDMRPEDERPQRPEPDGESPKEEEQKGKEVRDTVVLETKEQKERLAKEEDESDDSLEAPAEKMKRISLFGSLTIISGGTPEIIDLDKRLTVLGKSDEADVKCSGLLVGKTAALINKRPNGYFLSYAEGMKKPEVNNEPVNTQVQLHDGDEIVVGSTRMTFNLREEIS